MQHISYLNSDFCQKLTKACLFCVTRSCSYVVLFHLKISPLLAANIDDDGVDCESGSSGFSFNASKVPFFSITKQNV